MTIKARVHGGRLVVDEPTELPEGTEVELLALDPGDWLDETDRAALHQALRESNADVTAGRLVDATEILRDIRSQGTPAAYASRSPRGAHVQREKAGGLKPESIPRSSSPSSNKRSRSWR